MVLWCLLKGDHIFWYRAEYVSCTCSTGIHWSVGREREYEKAVEAIGWLAAVNYSTLSLPLEAPVKITTISVDSLILILSFGLLCSLNKCNNRRENLRV